jgi:hypothetical protein
LIGLLCGRDSFVIGSDKGVQGRLVQTVFPPGVVGGLDLNRAQGHDGRAGDDADFLAVNRRRKPFAKILLRIRNGERSHSGNIDS